MKNKQIQIILEGLERLIEMKKRILTKNSGFLMMIWQYTIQKRGLRNINLRYIKRLDLKDVATFDNHFARADFTIFK